LFVRIFKNAVKTRETVLFQLVGARKLQSPLAPFSARQALFRKEYQKITGRQQSIADLLAMPDAAEIEFEPPRLAAKFHELPDLT
jgi:hypothetical protein